MVTANTSETVLGTGDWTLISSGGDVTVTSVYRFAYAFTATATAPLEAFSGHPAGHHGFGVFRHDASPPDGVRFWVRSDQPMNITATAPV